jgi:hypothetical protein
LDVDARFAIIPERVLDAPISDSMASNVCSPTATTVPCSNAKPAPSSTLKPFR